ncbi:Spc97 / Spc98 family protein [Purpureocillium lavendulum]|uniref:Spindle pole body component n=1 Tax=Purpureocillium lavendulum TaxID=1247861 RepID=A0AB34G1M6_9HYPO|nr:Spc97 / Spc98 family protein [Purpureocillium lavendulum]
MLHEILLSLSGHPSPLLRSTDAESHARAGITPPERQLLASAAHLSDIHVKLLTYTSQISSSHPSAICRAVAAAVSSVHLAAFQRKVLEVEESILKDDPELVGAYNIVPLTAIMAEFKQWTRRMEWLWEVVQYMMAREKDGTACQGAELINRLRRELQSGYQDVADTALNLVTMAETAWLKQVSAWVLYGRLPDFGGDDFFVQKSQAAQEVCIPTFPSRVHADGAQDFVLLRERLPSFVTATTASSMLFIGKSLNHVRVMGDMNAGLGGLRHVSSKLAELGRLTFPLNGAAFARTVTSIRLSLSENTLQKILPLARVVEMLRLFREFFLLGRAEFALALTHEADEKIRHRWRRAGNLAYEKDDSLKNVTVKDGEVAAVLNRTWAVLASMQGNHAEEDELLELARDVLRLQLTKSRPPTPMSGGRGLGPDAIKLLEDSPFRNMLFSVPAAVVVELPSPLDMVIAPSDLQIYSCINSYLLSLRRAHIRLTDLWKITSLRRHHPAPPGAGEHAALLRQRWSARSLALRSSWTTASAAIFFLGETEAYLQTEIVEGMWETFSAWLMGTESRRDVPNTARSGAATPALHATQRPESDDEDLFLEDWDSKNVRQASRSTKKPAHDPQTLSAAHTLYLRTLVHRLLLTQPSFTDPLYALLVHIDHLVAHVQRLHSIYTSIDLETDAGVVDAFVDLEREEREVMALLRGVEGRVRKGIEGVVEALRNLENDTDFLAEWESQGMMTDDDDMSAGQRYAPGRIGGVNRLLMKLDFGSWLGNRTDDWEAHE